MPSDGELRSGRLELRSAVANLALLSKTLIVNRFMSLFGHADCLEVIRLNT